MTNGKHPKSNFLDRIHLIRLPLFPERKDRRFSMNVYFINSDPLTLIDTGPDQDEAFEALDRSLRNLGYTLSEVQRVLLTHPHVNHFGMAHRIKNLSGAQICGYRGDIEAYSTHPIPLKKGLIRLARLMRQSNLPRDDSKAILRRVSRQIRRAHRTPIDVAFDDGDMMEFEDFSLEVIRTPGHTSGHACFFSYEADVLFGGDHILESDSAHSSIMFDRDGLRYRSFPQYARSLKKIFYLAPSIIFPGHGKIVENSKHRIDEILRQSEADSAAVASVFETSSGNPFELQAQLNGMVERPMQIGGFSWLLGHLDLLRERGIITESLRGGALHYRKRTFDPPLYIRRPGHA